MEITDKFLMTICDIYGKWFKVEDDSPLTYFLDAQEGKKREKCIKKNDPWFEFEEYLNTNVRQVLRRELKEKDSSFRDMPVKIMRACVYVKETDDIN